jgi:hypothetical protein
MRTHKHKQQFMITADLMGVGIQVWWSEGTRGDLIWHGGARALPLSAVCLVGFLHSGGVVDARPWTTELLVASTPLLYKLTRIAITYLQACAATISSSSIGTVGGGYGWPLHLHQSPTGRRAPPVSSIGQELPCVQFCALLFPASQRLRCIVYSTSSVRQKHVPTSCVTVIIVYVRPHF